MKKNEKKVKKILGIKKNVVLLQSQNKGKENKRAGSFGKGLWQIDK